MEANRTSNDELASWGYPDDALVARLDAALHAARPDLAQIRLSPEAQRFVKRLPAGCTQMALTEAYESAVYGGRDVVLAHDVPFV